MNIPLRLSAAAFALLAAAAGIQFACFGKYQYVDDILTVDPLVRAQDFYAKGEYKQAQDYIEFYSSLPGVSEEESSRFDDLLARIQEKRQSLSYQVQELGRGFFLGSSQESYGKGAEVVSALVGVSDVRDLVEAGSHWMHGEEVDEVTASLAALGLVLTAAAIGPQAPAVVAAKTGVAILKTAAAAGKLSKPMRTSLKAAAAQLRAGKAAGALSPDLVKPVSELANYARSRGLSNALEVTARADSLPEIPRVIRTAEAFGPRAGAVLRYGGKDVVEVVQKRGAAEVLAVSKFGDRAVSALKTAPARVLLHDIRRWSAILASPLLKMLDLLLWTMQGVLGLLGSLAGFAGLRLWRKARKVFKNTPKA